MNKPNGHCMKDQIEIDLEAIDARKELKLDSLEKTNESIHIKSEKVNCLNGF